MDLGVMGRRRQKPCMLLGLSVLTVEMSSEEREAQPIFFCVNGDQFSAWVWFYALKRKEKEGTISEKSNGNITYSLS